MKSILTIGLLFFSLNLFAISNPQIRTCLAENGEFTTLQIDNDNVGLCKIGNSFIGSLDLVLLLENEVSESILNYSNHKLSCQGKIFDVFLLSANLPTSLCVHDDGSILDLKTLNLGRNSVENTALNTALDL
jgi:hypothetical protein